MAILTPDLPRNGRLLPSVPMGHGNSGNPALVVPLLLVFFFVGLLPFASSFLTYYPDERHYTDGALQMLRTGDYLTPLYADGNLRLNKPPLTYWIVVASYSLLGVSPLASRLPFLLINCGLLWLTYHLARQFFQSRNTAQIALIILMCSPFIFLFGVRSLPDIPLTFLLLVTAYGFLGLITTSKPASYFYWAAYLGTGTAILTKGLPVLVLVAFSWGFALYNPWARTPWRRLVHWPSMTVGFLIGISWFIMNYLIHGEQVFRCFFTDQVTERVSPNYTLIPLRFLLHLGGIAVLLLPWSLKLLAVLLVRRGKALPTRPPHQTAAAYLLGWATIMALLVSFTSSNNPRYLSYVAPALAILTALILTRVELLWLRRWFVVSVSISVALVLGFLVLVVAATFALGFSLTLTDGVLLALALGTIVGASQAVIKLRLSPALGLGMVLFVVYPIGYIAASKMGLPDQGEQIAAALEKAGHLEKKRICFMGEPGLAARIRVLTHGRARFYQWDQYEKIDASDFEMVIVPGEKVKEHRLDLYPRAAVSRGFPRLDGATAAQALWQGQWEQIHQARRQEHLFIFCSQNSE